MTQICTRCKRTSETGNLWCEEIDCPAGTLAPLMHYGDHLGNLLITRLVRNLRTAAIYECQRDKKPLLIKVSHPGFENYLDTEAEVLFRAQAIKNPALPVWVPHDTESRPATFGIASTHGQLYHFILLEHARGDILADSLLNNPEPWHKDAGWFVLSLCHALVDLRANSQNGLHMNLSPESIMVVPNKSGVMQPLLLDFGFQMPTGTRPSTDVLRCLVPAYTPPELLRNEPVTEASDVYEVGLIYYEMLAGRPAFNLDFRRDADVRSAIRDRRKAFSPNRGDLPGAVSIAPPTQNAPPKTLPPKVADIVSAATDPVANKRFSELRAMITALLVVYGPVPNKQRISPKQMSIIGISLFVVVIVVIVMLLLAVR